jgi:hypothetical protein
VSVFGLLDDIFHDAELDGARPSRLRLEQSNECHIHSERMAIQVTCEQIRIPIDVTINMMEFYEAQQRTIPISGQRSLT